MHKLVQLLILLPLSGIISLEWIAAEKDAAAGEIALVAQEDKSYLW